MRPTKATVSVAAAILSFLPEAPNAFTPALRRASPPRLTATSAESDDADGRESADWRAFRAKLVQEGLPSLSSAAASSAESEKATQRDHHRYAYETTPLVEVGTVLVSIPTTDLCQALEQQYWHRAVVLITDVSDDKINGAVETVPPEQLAQGAGRGKWSYRGVLLNRPTDLVFDDATGEQKHGTMSEVDGWKILRGGDLAGLDSSDGNTEFICFHDLSDDTEIGSVSTPLAGSLSTISLDDARQLCKDHPSKYNPGDFLTFGGFCSWRPQQLEREMGNERGEWLALSVDSESILGEMRLQYETCVSERISGLGRLEAGTTMWRNFLNLVQRSESMATKRLPAGQLQFYDEMLNIWAEENLSVDGLDEDDSSSRHKNDDSLSDSSNLIGPGTLVRATARVPNSVLLYDQEFIRSQILVLEETAEATVGVALSLPLSAAVECVEDAPPMLLRYGGPIDASMWRDGTYLEDDEGENEATEKEDDVYDGFLGGQGAEVTVEFGEGEGSDTAYVYYDDDDDDDEDSSFVWLHRDDTLGSKGEKNGGGIPLGRSGIYQINESDALEALQSGLLKQEDAMVFQGVCIWEKDGDLGQCGGGLREQVDALGAMEIVQARNNDRDDVIESVWDILQQKQDVLAKETLDANIVAEIEAWEACSSSSELTGEEKDSTCTDSGLSDAALRAWVGVNLLGKPLDTFVEVKKKDKQQRKEADLDGD